jgi:D-alanyl-D-alanine carboxypeptidase (penicillin-binding protein 5/6)
MRRLFPLAAVLLATLAVVPGRGQPPAPKELPPKAPADRVGGPPVVSAKGWAVADGKTGKLLCGSKEAVPLPIASTTKIMTAHLVFRLAADDAKVLDEVMVVSDRAAKTTGSGARIQAGEKYPVREMLFGLLLPSGNDAAVALAEHFGPRFKGDGKAKADAVELFVAEMNRQAKALKMTETTYLDPHGLSKNLSSPRNLAVLASVALQDKRFREYVGTRRRQYEVVTATGEKRAVTWQSTNQLLGIEGYDGVKTGTTTAAGACLVASGHAGSDHLLVVVLGCTSSDGRYVDSRNLFRWAWGERGHKAGAPATPGP